MSVNGNMHQKAHTIITGLINVLIFQLHASSWLHLWLWIWGHAASESNIMLSSYYVDVWKILPEIVLKRKRKIPCNCMCHACINLKHSNGWIIL